MSGMYGQFLIEGTDDYNKYYEKYKERINALKKLAEYTIEVIEDDCPEIKGMIDISYLNIRIAVARYFNDVVRYKLWHDITLTHKSKIIAHLIKWVSIHPILFCGQKEECIDNLCDESKITLMQANYCLISAIIDYIINNDINSDEKERIYEKTIRDLFYYLKTGGYDERMASLWFEKLI